MDKSLLPENKNDAVVVKTTSPFTIADIIISFGFIAAMLFLTNQQFIDLEFILASPQFPRSVRVLFIILIQELIILLPVFLLFYLRHRGRPNFSAAFAIHKTPFGKAMLSVTKWYLLYLLFSSIVGYIMLRMNLQIPGYGEGTSILPLFGNDEYTTAVILAVVLLVAPLVEELFFRSFLFFTLLKKIPYIWTSIITAAIFASIHLDFGAFIPRFILGLILNQIAMENNRSIVASWIFHVVNNGIALAVAMLLLPG